MAQINVERKRSGAWVWLLVGAIVFALIVWLLVEALDRSDEEPVGPMGPSESRSLEPEADQLATMEAAGIPAAGSPLPSDRRD